MSDTEKEQKETTEQVEKPEKSEKDEKWSKEKQRADQIEANYRKVTAERDEIQSQLTGRDEKIVTLEQKIEDIASDKDIPIEDLLDPDLVDAKTIKAVTKLARQIKEQQSSIKTLTKIAKDFEEKDNAKSVKSEKEKTIEKILKPLDDEFGAKYRNSARKLADKLVDEGSEPQPKDAIEAMTFMRKCYKAALKEAEEKGKKKPVRTDSGSASVSFDDSLPKSGSRRDILAEIRKKGLGLFGKSE